VLSTPPGTYLKFLEVQIDPEKSEDLQSIVQITFANLDKSWALHVRRGVAEVTEVVPDQVDATLSLPRLVWARPKILASGVLAALNAWMKAHEKHSEIGVAILFGLLFLAIGLEHLGVF